MPVYEYRCHTCGKEFEYTQRITEDAIKTCPIEICTSDKKGLGQVERRISRNVGLVFKGSGFYLTDYVHKNSSSGSPQRAKETEATSSVVTDVPKVTKTESATATKTDSNAA